MTELNDRELATVLAALRYWQAEQSRLQRAPLREHFTKPVTPLGSREIDRLCERLNGEEGQASIIVTLRDGNLTVSHGDDPEHVLARLDNAPTGSWRNLWAALLSVGIEPVGRATWSSSSPEDEQP
jgi:hypothetical protein